MRLLSCLHTRSKCSHRKVKFIHGYFSPLLYGLDAGEREGCYESWWRPGQTTCCLRYLCEVVLVTNVFEISNAASKSSTWQVNDGYVVHSQVERAYYCHLRSRLPSATASDASKKPMRHVTSSQAGRDAMTKMCGHLNVERFQAQRFNVRARPHYY